MRLTSILAVILVVVIIGSSSLPVAVSLPPLENSLVFPVGTFVIPMDELQAERILVFGFIHALLRSPNPIQLFRIIEPPNVALSTNMTASPKEFAGGPFLISAGDASKVLHVKNSPEFQHVTVGTLTSQHVLNNIFRVRDPTKILVVKGLWGRTDITLDEMKIPYNITTRETLEANPNMIFSFSLIVVDCYGWSGNIPSQVASNIRSHVNSGNEVIFTDIALKDMDSAFPGYVTIAGPQPMDKVASAYAYSPPRKYDPTKYGSSADRFQSEFPGQYFNSPPYADEINVFTESAGYVVSSVPSAKTNDVRIMADSRSYGLAGNEYAILAFYFEYGDGIVEGLAFHPQQQEKSLVGEHGYYAVYQLYGNKFVHGIPAKLFSLDATPTTVSTPQGGSATFTLIVKSFGAFNSPVTLALTGLPSPMTYSFNPPAPQPPIGGTASSTLTVNVPFTTPAGTYVMNVTGKDPSSPPITKWVLLTLIVTIRPADFDLSVSPNSLAINVTESKIATVTVTSLGAFNQNVTLNATGLPSDVTVTFTPPSVRPPEGGTASSIMRISVGANASNGTYIFNVVGSNGTKTKSKPFTLTIVKLAPPPLPIMTILLILALAMMGIVLSLLAYAISSRKRAAAAPPARFVGPVPSAVPPRPQRMYVVPMAAQRVRCPYCGRPIAIQAVYCPYCGRRRSTPVTGAFVGPVSSTRPVPARRAVWGFVLAIVSAVLIILNAVALLSPSFWGPPTNWSAIFWWLGGPSGLGQSLAMLIGIVSGFTVMTGGIMMIMRRGTLGALVTFPFAVISILIGGGFLAGVVLGIAAGILGAVGR